MWKQEMLLFIKKYKSVRNAVIREIRKIVRNEQHEAALQCKSYNPKKFWNYINSKRTTKSAIGDLVTRDNYGNTVIVSGYEQKAEVLGSYFSEVFTKKICILKGRLHWTTKYR